MPRQEFGAADGLSPFEPVVLSASRTTDIPAFYADWFAERIREGGFPSRPFWGEQESRPVSLARTRVILFWTKYVAPLLPHLPLLDDSGINYYFQHTVNDYTDLGVEPRVPPLELRVEAFVALSERIGKRRVIWRFTPLVRTTRNGVDDLLERIGRVGDLVAPYTEKLVFNFFEDNERHPTSLRIAGSTGHPIVPWTPDDMLRAAEGIVALNQAWGLEVATCAEEIELSGLSIAHNSCLDPQLLLRVFGQDLVLANHVEEQLRLLGGRRPDFRLVGFQHCGCMPSVDIGFAMPCHYRCDYCFTLDKGPPGRGL